jgi:hypothetical protein
MRVILGEVLLGSVAGQADGFAQMGADQKRLARMNANGTNFPPLNRRTFSTKMRCFAQLASGEAFRGQCIQGISAEGTIPPHDNLIRS